MLSNEQKIQIEARNKKISDGILIAQLTEHKGYAILNKYLEEKKQEIRYQDILGIKDLETLHNQQGIAVCISDIENFIDEMKQYSLQPMQDSDTGELEVLNAKKTNE